MLWFLGLDENFLVFTKIFDGNKNTTSFKKKLKGLNHLIIQLLQTIK